MGRQRSSQESGREAKKYNLLEKYFTRSEGEKNQIARILLLLHTKIERYNKGKVTGIHISFDCVCVTFHAMMMIYDARIKIQQSSGHLCRLLCPFFDMIIFHYFYYVAVTATAAAAVAVVQDFSSFFHLVARWAVPFSIGLRRMYFWCFSAFAARPVPNSNIFAWFVFLFVVYVGRQRLDSDLESDP